jgi:hypothetical protein
MIASASLSFCDMRALSGGRVDAKAKAMGWTLLSGRDNRASA